MRDQLLHIGKRTFTSTRTKLGDSRDMGGELRISSRVLPLGETPHHHHHFEHFRVHRRVHTIDRVRLGRRTRVSLGGASL